MRLREDPFVRAAQALATTGVTHTGAQAAMEFDYIASGGNPQAPTSDANAFQGVSTITDDTPSSSPPPAENQA